MKSRLLSILKFAIGWPFSILAFIFIFKLIAPQASTVYGHLTHIDIFFLFYGIISFLLFYFIRSYIWHRLLRSHGSSITFAQTSYLWSVSEARRYIPGNIWSFLGRTVLFHQKGISKKIIGTCLVVEAELFVLGSVILSLLAIPFITKYIFPSLIIIPIDMVIYFVCLLTILYIFHTYLENFVPEKLKKISEFLIPGLPPVENILLVGLSMVSLIFFALGYFFLCSTLFPVHPQLLLELIGFFVFSFIVGYLTVLTPAGFGVRESILISGLTHLTTAGIAAFAVLFSRILLIVTEIIFIALVFLYKTYHEKLKKVENLLFNHKQELIVFGLMAIYIIYFTQISFLRYDNFYAGRFDLGNMAQTVWNTLHGRIFEFTNPNGTDTISRLAFHADFFLILLTPFYALWPDPRMLLLIQTLVLAAGAYFVYLISNTVLKNKNISVIFALSYLLNPSIERSNIYDFHSGTLATAFLLGTFYFYIKRRYWLFGVFAILAGFCKEEVWLIIGLFGVFIFIHHKKRFLGALITVISLALFYYLVSYLIPHSLRSQHFALSYYSDFGDTPTKVIKSIIFSPKKILAIVLAPASRHYLDQLFSPLGYLSIFAPLFLLFTIPDFLVNLLSNNTQLHQIYYQYTADISSFLFIAAIYGVFVIKYFFPKIQYAVFALYILIFTLAAAYTYGPLPGAKEPNLDMMVKQVQHQKFINKYLSLIPKQYSVAASNNIGSHLSQRQRIYTLPLGIDKADIIVFMLNDSEVMESLKVERKQVEQLRKDPKYKMTIELNEFIVFVKQTDIHR